VTQDSLRAQIGMVTQDTSLLHRSVRDNILYGRPDASDADMLRAAERAEAHDFIVGLSDPKGRTATTPTSASAASSSPAASASASRSPA
jgi:ATP-binding cassette subfamily B multidrug efflux pump